MSLSLRRAWAIWLVVSLILLLIAAAATLMVREIQREADATARSQAERWARDAEVALNSNFLGIDLQLAGLRNMPGLLGSDARIADASTASAILRAHVDHSLAVRDLMLLDAADTVVAAADAATLRLGASLPPGFAAAVRAQAAPALAVSGPATNFSTGEKVLYLARAMGSRGPERLLAVAVMPVSVLTTIMAPAVGVDGLTLTLENENGTLLASAPARDSLLGRRSEAPLSGSAASGVALLAPGRLGAEPSFLSVRPTLYSGMLVSAGISEAATREHTREARAGVAWVGLAFALLAVGIGVLAQVYFGRLQVATTEIARARVVLDEALASMDEGFLLWSADDRVVSWNDRYLAFFPHQRGVIAPGVEFAVMLEVGARALLSGMDEAQRTDYLRERTAAHHADGHEYEQRLPDGLIVSSVERRTMTGGIVSVYRDVTRARAAAAELERSRQAAESASAAKTRFLATMSHEIRTPLNGVLGMNGLLLDTTLDATQRRYAETVRSSGQALLTLINDILDMSRLDAGRLRLELAPVRPGELVDEVVSALGARAREKGIELRVTQDAAHEPLLLGDAGRLRQVLFNLVGNAIKFTDHGVVAVEAQHRPLGAGRIEWSVSVRDTGIGIPAEALPSLFEHFTQADSSTSRRFGGSGLGLAICHHLVELMGGQIHVTSQVGQGSEFRVSVPLDPAPALQDAATELAPGGVASTALASDALHVLVAEDNPVNRILMLAMLEQMGHRADVVEDGLEAVRQVQMADYDLVLMDVQMPVMDGEAATRLIRALPGAVARVPIVAVSANVLPAQREAYLAAGMNDHVPKPFDRQRLAEAIDKAMGRVAAG